ncbi:CbiX/SirB N-terminal domain-containing protein [uncultured Dechloromonas sp.]|uniref:sirohydrochlorin chelatase n=1 Tax=uncultured Dechloromonas sp. TaxID=171719 RepID=UPI0025D95717|nr:CbiX/SirB N-terminal domain-containing protein [uncultured Dechloromonas sp.]
MNTALILFAHGARDPEWADPMRRVQAAVRQLQPATRVELAFLEFIAPTLGDCIAGLIGDGVEKIVVMPMFIARGGHLKRDVPDLLAALRLAHPGVEFVLGDAIGAHESVVQAMAAAALAEAGLQLAE